MGCRRLARFASVSQMVKGVASNLANVTMERRFRISLMYKGVEGYMLAIAEPKTGRKEAPVKCTRYSLSHLGVWFETLARLGKV